MVACIHHVMAPNSCFFLLGTCGRLARRSVGGGGSGACRRPPGPALSKRLP